jgi:hypothetical protein
MLSKLLKNHVAPRLALLCALAAFGAALRAEARQCCIDWDGTGRCQTYAECPDPVPPPEVPPSTGPVHVPPTDPPTTPGPAPTPPGTDDPPPVYVPHR